MHQHYEGSVSILLESSQEVTCDLRAANALHGDLIPVDEDLSIFQEVYLRALPVVLVLAGELLVGELVQDLADACGGLGQHGLHRDPRDELHMLWEVLQCRQFCDETCQGPQCLSRQSVTGALSGKLIKYFGCCGAIPPEILSLWMIPCIRNCPYAGEPLEELLHIVQWHG